MAKIVKVVKSDGAAVYLSHHNVQQFLESNKGSQLASEMAPKAPEPKAAPKVKVINSRGPKKKPAQKLSKERSQPEMDGGSVSED